MVKARRNRQPRDWRNMTHERSHSGILRGAEVVKVSKLTVQAQLKKAEKNLKKLKRNIQNHKDAANKAHIEPGNKAWHEGAIRQLEKRLVKTTISVMALRDKDEKQEQQYKDHKEQEQKALDTRRARAKEIKVQEPRYGRIEGFHPGLAGKGRIVEKVETVGGKRRVRRKWREK